MTTNKTPEQHITCKTCGRSDVPDWDGNGHCITCTRAAVLGDTPEQRLEAALDKRIYHLCRRIQQNKPLEMDTFKAAILAAVTAELRAIVPEKLQAVRDSEGDTYFTDTQDGWNQAIDTMITNAKARGFDL
jgi:hypothetical protein